MGLLIKIIAVMSRAKAIQKRQPRLFCDTDCLFFPLFLSFLVATAR